ncbi:MAG: hypothetical protein GXO27_05465, partial [Chlorobi bacterium]|nr:hypothetical protein [Chlorobiota bacterium]
TAYTNPFRLLFILGVVLYFSKTLIDRPPDQGPVAPEEALYKNSGIRFPPTAFYLKKLDSMNRLSAFTDRAARLPPGRARHLALDRTVRRLAISDSLYPQSLPRWQAAMFTYTRDRWPGYRYVPPLDEIAPLSSAEQLDTFLVILSLPPFKDMSPREIWEESGLSDAGGSYAVLAAAKSLSDLFAGNLSPAEFIRRFLSRFTLGMFFMLPFFTFVIYLIFRSAPYNYAETLASMFYLQNVYLAVLIAGVWLGRIPVAGGLAGAALNLWFWRYLVKSFEKLYAWPASEAWLKVTGLVIPLYMIFGWLALLLLLFVTLILG